MLLLQFYWDMMTFAVIYLHAMNPNPHPRDKVLEDEDAGMPASRTGKGEKLPPKPKKEKTWHDLGSEAVLEIAG